MNEVMMGEVMGARSWLMTAAHGERDAFA